VIIRAPGPEAAERGGGGGGAIHGDLDGEGGGGEGRERRGEAGWGRERDAGGEEEDHEALAGEQSRRRRRRRGRRRGGAREPGHRRWSARYANAAGGFGPVRSGAVCRCGLGRWLVGTVGWWRGRRRGQSW